MPINKKAATELEKTMEVFVKDHNLHPPKCISDKAELYIRYIFYKLRTEPVIRMGDYGIGTREEWRDKDLVDDAEALAINFMKQVRGTELVGNMSPRTTATSLVYIACTMRGLWSMSQVEICDYVAASEATLRKNYKIYRKVLQV